VQVGKPSPQINQEKSSLRDPASLILLYLAGCGKTKVTSKGTGYNSWSLANMHLLKNPTTCTMFKFQSCKFQRVHQHTESLWLYAKLICCRLIYSLLTLIQECSHHRKNTVDSERTKVEKTLLELPCISNEEIWHTPLNFPQKL
jgi:hypothetical protein